MGSNVSSIETSHARVAARLPNYIVFGEMGAGKSSLINLIAGKECAKSSPDATSCTLKSTEYEIELPDLHFNIFDTMGLNEPTMSTENYLDAIVKAHALIASLKERGGIDGLLFCIRGGRISETTQKNYRLFHEFLCQGEVPLALVITGLEGETDMDDWWTRNKAHVNKCGIPSFTHVCITTTMGYKGVYADRYRESRGKVHNMLREFEGRVGRPLDMSSWFARFCKKLRELLVPALFAWMFPGPSNGRMLQVLVSRCQFSNDDAKELLQRIEAEK